jgi:hypothetical protein
MEDGPERGAYAVRPVSEYITAPAGIFQGFTNLPGLFLTQWDRRGISLRNSLREIRLGSVSGRRWAGRAGLITSIGTYVPRI